MYIAYRISVIVVTEVQVQSKSSTIEHTVYDHT